MTTSARTALSLVLALALSGCGSADSSDSGASGGSAGGSGAGAQLQPGATLLGTVGTPDEPEAFEIALTTEDGQPVDVVAAGTYTLVVTDLAQTHNFHLEGDGIDVATGVAATGEETFEVTFEAGEYGYLCDPHPSMSGSLRVI